MKYLIGEVSKIYSISMDTLRYYDKIGLLRPKTNLENGYRYYETEHLEKLMFILSAKEVEIPLSEIKSVLDSEDLKEYKKLLKKQQEIIKDKINHLQKLDRVLLNRSKELDRIIDFKNNYDFNKINVSNTTKTFYRVALNDLKKDKDLVEIIDDIYDKSIGINNSPKEEDIFYSKYKILDDDSLVEDEQKIYISENSINKDILDNYFSDKEKHTAKIELKDEYILTEFYGNEEELTKYIISIKKHFNINKDNEIYVGFHFNLSKKVKSEYFCEIIYKI